MRIKTSLLLIFSLLACFSANQVEANELALNKNAKLAGTQTIPMLGLQKLNGITIEQLYKLRSDAVARYPKLLADTYEPSDTIFGLCESKKPWWGIWGMQLYREGPHSIDGPAKESVYLLNPYRLVSAEATNTGLWNPKTVTEADKRNPSFPFIWESGPVLFNPGKAIAEVTYDLSKYNERINKLQDRMLHHHNQINDFSLIAYNARDFGYHYMYLDPHKSVAIKPWPDAQTVGITQMLHCGGSCGYPGGCNNMSPSILKLDYNTLLKLPARAYLKLWSEEPPSVGDPADFTFIINFK